MNSINPITFPRIGGPVRSGTAGSVLFVGSSTDIQQDNTNFVWDNSGTKLSLGSGTSQAIFNNWAGVRLELYQGSTGTPTAVAGPTLKVSRTQQIDVDDLGANKDDIEGTAAISGISLGSASDEVLACGIHGGASTASTVTGIDAFGFVGRGRVTGSGVGIGGGGYFVGRRDTNTGKANGAELRCWNYTTTAGAYSSSGISNTQGLWIVSDGISATPFDSGCGVSLGGLNSTKFKVGYAAVGAGVKWRAHGEVPGDRRGETHGALPANRNRQRQQQAAVVDTISDQVNSTEFM